MLAAARKEDDQRAPPLCEVHAVSRTDVDPQLGHALAYWLDVARIPRRQPFEAHLDSRPAADIAQIVQPTGEALSLAQLDH
jgi:hypothetical protein